MKKLLSFSLIALSCLLMFACGGDVVTWSGVENKTINVGDTFDAKAGVKAEDKVDGDISDRITVDGYVNANAKGDYKLTYKVTGSDSKEYKKERTISVAEGSSGNATTITIMHGAVQEVDPFHASYSGKNAREKQLKQREVEALYNVKVVYKPYDQSASWGEPRTTAIVNASINGTPMADIYWVSSDWIGKLVKGQAVVPVDDWMSTHGSNINEIFEKIGGYQDQMYAFETGAPYAEIGLYYNAALVKTLGVSNPTQMYLDGNWTWSTFESWAKSVKSALGEEQYALGGAYSAWAEALVPLNGGRLVSLEAKRVAFAQQAALDAYDYITGLKDAGLFEPSGTFDSGSAAWQAGNVVMHPGRLWFVTAPDRWGQLPFQVEYVPYPISDTYKAGGGEHISPVSGVSTYTVASGLPEGKAELAFKVWNALQLWKSAEDGLEEFTDVLKARFNEQTSITAFLSVYDKIYLDVMNALGISAYESNGWTVNIIAGIREGIARTKMDEIKPAYELALKTYLGEA
ncbi:extracellular solute-binding protein [Acholeplasma sp. OttesenSCG-928-E16]|nr:extracellular solute-binding protein [Acholeplasma sp. OttesenSCG-928-E16]